MVNVGKLEIEIIDAPGHTPDSICYNVKGVGLFVGDTVFYPDGGSARCDFPNGSAKLLWNTIQKLLSFPDETKIYLCHDYGVGGRDFKWETTVGEQKRSNIHIKTGTTEEEFVAFRTKRDAQLTSPKIIIPSLQVNLNAGLLPTAEDNGISYLKIPVNVFKL